MNDAIKATNEKANPMNKRTQKKRTSIRRGNKASTRRGAAVVEFAVVAPVMIMLTFGLIELGRLSMLKDSAIHASREGARVGIKPAASESEVIESVNSELGILGVSNASVETSFHNQNGDEVVEVNVSIPIEGNSWVPGFLNAGVTHIVGNTTMRRESTR